MKTKAKQASFEPAISQKDLSAILELYCACLRNVQQLIEEAQLLFDHEHFARAFALAIFAYEEIGKSQIVADLFNDLVSKKEFEVAFKQHDIKLAYNTRQFIITEANPWIQGYIDYTKGKNKEYLQWRMAGMYVDCDENFQTKEPTKEITKDNASKAIEFVTKKIAEIKKMEYLTERIGSKSFMK